MAESDFIDVSGDGGLMKKIVEAGDGLGFPETGNEVEAHYTGGLK